MPETKGLSAARLSAEWEEEFGDHEQCPVCGTQCRDKYMEEPSTLISQRDELLEALKEFVARAKEVHSLTPMYQKEIDEAERLIQKAEEGL